MDIPWHERFSNCLVLFYLINIIPMVNGSLHKICVFMYFGVDDNGKIGLETNMFKIKKKSSVKNKYIQLQKVGKP